LIDVEVVVVDVAGDQEDGSDIDHDVHNHVLRLSFSLDDDDDDP
jgi:hypothetical protein